MASAAGAGVPSSSMPRPAMEVVTQAALAEFQQTGKLTVPSVGTAANAKRLLFELCLAVSGGDISPDILPSLLTTFDFTIIAPTLDVPSVLADALAYLSIEMDATSAPEAHANLVKLVKELLKAKVFKPVFLKERFELEFLEACGLDVADKFHKREIRVNTRQLYTQTKFNLLREESEGFAKLITLLNNPEAWMAPNIALQGMQSLIGYFDLDPNRALDILLDSYELHLQKTGYLQLLPAFNRAKVCHVLGFNFEYYRRPDVAQSTPELLYLLAAAVIKAGQVDIDSLYGHLSPADADAKEAHALELNRRLDIAKRIGVTNLLAATDEDAAASAAKQADEAEEALTAKVEPWQEDNQKLGLLCAFLKFDDWPHAVQLLDRLSDLDPVSYPPVAAALFALVERTIKPLYRRIAPFQISEKSSTRPALQWQNLVAMLRHAGYYLHHNIVLLVKVARVLRERLVTQGAVPVANISSAKVSPQVRSARADVEAALGSCLLPSLSLIPANAGVVFEVWEVLKLLPYQSRYRLYAEWKTAGGDKTPALVAARIMAVQATKKVMRRIAKENIKQMGRQLAKATHANPVVTMGAIVSQIEAYNTMIGPVVDSFKFLTNMTYDVLAYVIVERLALGGRDKLKSDGTNIAGWLQSLASFTGHLCRKTAHVDLAGLLQYIVNQLKDDETLDLLVLKELIARMAVIETVEDLNDEQLEALAGGDALRGEATSLGMSRPGKVMKRLRDALQPATGEQLAVPLLLLIAQERNVIMYRSQLPHLKLIVELYDKCQDTLLQYVEFLQAALTPSASYLSILPPLLSLFMDFYLPAEVAFFIYRPLLGKLVTQGPTEAMEIDESHQANGKVDAKPQFRYSDFLTVCRQVLPPEATQLNELLYATFWGLSLYDIYCPTDRYTSEIERQKVLLKQLEDSRDTLPEAITRRKKEKTRIQETLDHLVQEKDSQQKHVQAVFSRLTADKDDILPGSVDRKEVIQQLLQTCIFPRLMFSSTDAVYSAKFAHQLHRMGTPGFQSLHYFDHAIKLSTQIVVCCTESEAGRLGKYLQETLQLLLHWQKSKAVYEAECESLPGFAKNPHEDSGRASYEDFLKLCSSWQQRLTKAFSFFLETKEHVRIRNALLVLTRIVKVFPATKKASRAIELRVTKLKSDEEREDLKLIATRYHGLLVQRRPLLLTDEQFNPYGPKPAKGAAGDGPDASGTPADVGDTEAGEITDGPSGDKAAAAERAHTPSSQQEKTPPARAPSPTTAPPARPVSSPSAASQTRSPLKAAVAATVSRPEGAVSESRASKTVSSSANGHRSATETVNPEGRSEGQAAGASRPPRHAADDSSSIKAREEPSSSVRERSGREQPHREAGELQHEGGGGSRGGGGEREPMRRQQQPPSEQPRSRGASPGSAAFDSPQRRTMNTTSQASQPAAILPGPPPGLGPGKVKSRSPDTISPDEERTRRKRARDAAEEQADRKLKVDKLDRKTERREERSSSREPVLPPLPPPRAEAYERESARDRVSLRERDRDAEREQEANHGRRQTSYEGPPRPEAKPELVRWRRKDPESSGGGSRQQQQHMDVLRADREDEYDKELKRRKVGGMSGSGSVKSMGGSDRDMDRGSSMLPPPPPPASRLDSREDDRKRVKRHEKDRRDYRREY